MILMNYNVLMRLHIMFLLYYWNMFSNLKWIGFKLNWIGIEYWIEMHWMEFEFNSNLVEFNSTIALRFNWREWDQIGGEGSENLLCKHGVGSF
jgi:hypothetical protein